MFNGNEQGNSGKNGNKLWMTADSDFLQNVWFAVPVYNNPATVRDVVLRCLAVCPNTVVVDDGSTTGAVSESLEGVPVPVLRHERNLGKGRALLTALEWIAGRGGQWMVAIDADGQHEPADLAAFLPVMREDPAAIVIGARDFSAENVPDSSRFGRAFSNFWVQLETGTPVEDSQSGFRAYPVDWVRRLPLHSNRYDFEIEVLARAAWAGLRLRSVPIRVWYPPPGQRVSSFHPWKDNARITRMHIRLVGRRLVPWPARRLVARRGEGTLDLLRHPQRFIRALLHENASPAGLAAAAGMGVLLGTLPLPGLHSLVILYVALRLNLNKVMALSIQTLCAPPLVPVLSVEAGYLLLHGRLIAERNPRVLLDRPGEYFLYWVAGSVVLAPLLAAVAAGVVYKLACRIQHADRAAKPSVVEEVAS